MKKALLKTLEDMLGIPENRQSRYIWVYPDATSLGYSQSVEIPPIEFELTAVYATFNSIIPRQYEPKIYMRWPRWWPRNEEDSPPKEMVKVDVYHWSWDNHSSPYFSFGLPAEDVNRIIAELEESESDREYHLSVFPADGYKSQKDDPLDKFLSFFDLKTFMRYRLGPKRYQMSTINLFDCVTYIYDNDAFLRKLSDMLEALKITRKYWYKKV